MEWRWLLLAVLVGLGLSLYPHVLAWSQTGSPTWIASFDEFECYLPLAANAWHNHPWYLADPWQVSGGDSMFPWLQIVPATLVAKLTGVDPFDVCLIWRAWAGFGLPVGYYLLIRRFVNTPAATAGIVIMLLCASGMIESRLDRHLFNWFQILRHGHEVAFSSWPTLLHQFRLITPGLSWFFLFVFLWQFEAVIAEPSRRNMVLTAGLLGLLVWLYFYFWTAAFVLLGLAWLTHSARRRPLFIVALVGGLLGLPSVLLQRAAQKQYPHDWLQRVDKFVVVDRWHGFYMPPVAVASLVLVTVFVWWRHRDLRHLWFLAVAGYGLINHQLLTRLQIENMHWQYVMAPMLCVLIAVIGYREAVRRFGQTRWHTLWFGGLVVAYFVTGIQLRHWEVTRSRHPREINTALLAYRAEAGELGRIPWEPRAQVAGDDLFAGLVSWDRNLRPFRLGVGYSPQLTHDDLDTRCALDDLLEGHSLQATIERASARYTEPGPGPWHWDSALRARRIAHAQQVAGEIASDINGAARRADVRYVALKASAAPPDYLRSGWRQLHHGKNWQIWQHDPITP